MAKPFQIPLAFKSDPRGIKDAQGAIDGFGKKLAGIAGLVAGAFSIRAIGNFAKESVLAAEAAATAQARLEAVAKATGVFGEETAKVTDRLGEFAKANEMRIAVDDKVIKGVQAQLLTFKALSATADEQGGIFDRTTIAAFDMAAVFGSADSAAMGLAKALEDPATGMGRLTKQGVMFTDEQKELVKSLQASGDLLGAQEIILGEVESQFGGVAAATADASDKLAIAFDNIKETAGAALLPVFAELVEGLMPVTEILGTVLADAFTALSPVLSNIVGMLPGLIEAFIPMIPIIGSLAEVFFTIIEQVLPVFVELFAELLPVIEELVPILGVAFLEVLDALLPIFLELIDALLPIVVALLPVLLDLIVTLAPVFVTLIEAIMPLIETVLPLMIQFIEFMTPLIVWLAELLGVIMVVAVDFLVTRFESAQKFFQKFGEFFVKLWGNIQRIFVTVINGMISGFESFINFFVSGFNSFINGVNAIRAALDMGPLNLVGSVTFGRVPMPEIPALAEGGIVKASPGGTLARIGEGGQDEAVIPLGKMGSLGNTYNITVNAGMGTDGAEVGRKVLDSIRAYERRNGKVFASA